LCSPGSTCKQDCRKFSNKKSEYCQDS
jgi:hypothetical protein